MKHHPSIVKKIRKLLRLSKTPGPEGERALERARELMQRHEIDEVSLDQRIMVEVPGVDGEVWREQVLLAVVQAAGVELQPHAFLRPFEGQRIILTYQNSD